jgi:hypothetical protein
MWVTSGPEHTPRVRGKHHKTWIPCFQVEEADDLAFLAQGVPKLFILALMPWLHTSRIVMMILGFRRGLHRCLSLAVIS